jgi:chromosome segregation ATPase
MLSITVIAIAFLATPVCGTDANLTVLDSDLTYHSLLQVQTKAVQAPGLPTGVDQSDQPDQEVMTMLEKARTSAAGGPINIDNAHLVVHCHGCEEVQAQLQVVTQQIATANAKLDECSKHRKKLQGDLAAAAKERAVAESDLKKCATARQTLANDLAKCASDRGKAEKALAQCAADRAKLEAELKQCAEVDRPNAEKELAKCAVERQELEKELAAVAAKLKKAEGTSSARRRRTATSVRRRRRAVKKSASLMQVHPHQNSLDDAGETEEEQEEQEDGSMSVLEALDDAESSQLEARHAAITERLAALTKEEGIFEVALDKVLDSSNMASTRLAELEDELEMMISGIADLDKREALKTMLLKKAERAGEAAVALLNKLQQQIELADEELSNSNDDVSAAAAEVAATTAVQIETQQQLIGLVQQAQHLRHKKLQIAHKEAGHRLGEAEALLEKKASDKDHKECNDLRAKVVLAKGRLDAAASALADCFQAKKDIQAKIDKVEKLRADAQGALDSCLQAKAKLKAQVEECHTRRDAARQKLEECLERKKDLKVKIEACHEKRDEARAKLAECMKNKKILHEKIAKAKAGLAKKSSLMEVQQESSVDDEVQDALGYVNEILAALRKANEDADINAKEYMEIDKMITDAADEIANASEEEKKIFAELQAASQDEGNQQKSVVELQTALQHAILDLKEIDAKTQEAESEAEAAGQITDELNDHLAQWVTES